MQIKEFSVNDEIELQSSLQETLINTLSEHGPMTRDQLVEMIETPRTTVYDNLDVLMSRNTVTKFSRQVNARGRPVVFWKIKYE